MREGCSKLLFESFERLDVGRACGMRRLQLFFQSSEVSLRFVALPGGGLKLNSEG